MEKKKIKAGIIGFGYMGNFHLNRMKSGEGIEAYAAYDIDPEKLEDARGENLLTFSSLEEMLTDEEIQLAVICTPNDVHADIAVKALEAGKHVLCEKPATLTVAELERVLSCAEKNNRIFTTHLNRRWDADYGTVKKVLENKSIGEPTTLISQVFGQRGVCFGWRGDPAKGGGMLYDWGIHLIDQILMLFPQQKVVSVYARLRSILTPAVDDYFEAELEFEGDVIAHILVGTFALQELPRWYIFGDKGTLKLKDFSGKEGGLARIKENIRGFERVPTGKKMGPSRTMAHLERENLEEIPLPVAEEEPYAFYRNLTASIRGEEKSLVTKEQMLRDMKVIEAIFQSDREKMRLEVEI